MDRLVAEHLRVRWLAGVGTEQRDEPIDAWQDATDSAVKLGHVPEQARVRAAHAQVLRLTGDPVRARDEAETARALAERTRSPRPGGRPDGRGRHLPLRRASLRPSGCIGRPRRAGADRPRGRDPGPRRGGPLQRRDRQAGSSSAPRR
ncbi:hypothetical protein [Nocardioides convexus]|uniref:hypothetical protein n=1 Tax=Nocardioides convexus TaxID=2712224 RepID=UPI0024184873|nr:hypothetical protein [Nocardioides convexus]